MRALVLGAAGFLGVNLVDALVADGVVPLCGRRRRENVLPLRSRRVPMAVAELDEPESLVAAMEGRDTVFHAAGYYPRTSLDREATLRTGFAQVRNALSAAERAGVRRFVYVSSTATVAPSPCGPSTEAHAFAAAPGYGPYHDVKWVMEQEVLARDRLEVVVACAAGCLGPWDLRVATSAMLVGLARGMPVPHPDGVINLVDVRDVARALLRVARDPAPPRRVLLSGGTWRLHPLLVSLAPRYGVSEPGPALPAEEALRLADAEETRCAREGGRPAISREIVDLVVHGVPVDASLAERTLGMRWTPLPDTLDAFDAWARRMRLIPEPRFPLENRP